MKVELLKMLDENEIMGLAEALRIDTEGLTMSEIWSLIARKLND
jgi:hypothetical protein